MTIDHLALLPAYLAAATAVLVLVTDLVAPGRRAPVLVAGAVGAAATAVAALTARRGAAFCTGGDCSYVLDRRAALVGAVFALLTLGVLALSAGVVRELPPGEYAFLLAASMTGGVVLGAARDLPTLFVAVETLTLPLYVLVGLRRRSLASARAAVTFFVVSVVATSVALLGAGLLYAATGAVHLGRVAAALAAGPPEPLAPLATVGIVLLLGGLAFKVAAVPLHAWAPATYDGAPLPVAAYLSTASKLGGVVAILTITVEALEPRADVAGPTLAALAVATMTVGNLVALRQRRMVRLLAWSSIAQAGYILAPLGALAAGRGRDAVVAAALAYAVFYVLLELGAFAAVVALRGDGDPDGGPIAGYRGAARRAPWAAAGLLLALAGLAGLPPGLAGLFAKVAVVRALLVGDAAWLAVVVAVNAVVGLAYYVRVAATLFEPAAAVAPATTGPARRAPWPVVAGLAAATLAAVLLGFAPQLVLAAAR